MKKLISVTFIFLLTAIAFPQEIKWFGGTFEEAKIEARKTGKNIIIEFFTGSG